MKILVSNDDGYQAEGIRTLVKELSLEHEVYVCAPDIQKSASSHSVTYFLCDHIAGKVKIEGAREAWMLNGTPADCVYFGLNALMKDREFDLVVSGINHGSNLSSDVIYSGTVAAAMEAVIGDVPAIAMSLCSRSPADFTAAARICRKVIPFYMSDPMRRGYVLNVNVPDLPYEEIKGFRFTRQEGRKLYPKNIELTETEEGLLLHCDQSYGQAVSITVNDRGDESAVKDGYVSLTPLAFWLEDLNHLERLDEMQKIYL